MTLPRRPTAAVFDLDGTLIDSETLVREAHMQTCPEFGVSMSDAQFLALVGLPREANDVRLREYFGPDFPLEQFHRAKHAYVGDRVAPLKPGAMEVLDAFAASNTPLGLATSSRPNWVNRHFAAHKLSDRFAAIVTRVDCENGKPHPEPYQRVLRLMKQSAPGDVLALEDSPTGVRSAHAAGLMTVMIPDLLAPDEEMRAKAVAVLDSLQDILPLLDA